MKQPDSQVDPDRHRAAVSPSWNASMQTLHEGVCAQTPGFQPGIHFPCGHIKSHPIHTHLAKQKYLFLPRR